MPDSPTSHSAAEIAAKLDAVLAALMPLHALLQAQETVETQASERLHDLLQQVSTIAERLGCVAETLTQVASTGTLSPSMAAAFDRIVAQQIDQQRQLRTLETQIETLMSWLGTPPAPR